MIKIKDKISNIIIIIIFIIIITIPTIISWAIGEDTNKISKSENRKLTEKPDFKLETIAEYPKKFDEYYNDHLPLRESIIKVWSDINYDIFNTSANKLTIIGKNDWLFYRGNNTVNQIQGMTEVKNEDKQYILQTLELNIEKLKQKDIEMCVLILPNKEKIYKEYLPDSIPIKGDISEVEGLIDYIRDNSDINIIYPKKELLEQKDKYQIYRKYDTHWNKIGACIGAVALQKGINKEFSYDMNDIEVEEIEEKDLNDLAEMIKQEEKLYENILRVKNFYTDIEYTVNDNEKYEEYISNSTNEKTVLFVGDSFRKDIKEYFSKLYKKVIYVHRDDYTEDIIEIANPNILVFETVERYYASLGMQLIK